MLHDFAKPLTVVVGRSRRLMWALAAIHALALTAAILTAIDGWVTAALSLAVVASAVASFRRHVYIDSAWGTENAVLALREHAGEYSVRLRASAAFVPVALIGFTVLSFAVLLDVRAATWRRSRIAIVANDAVDADTFHHLRARLRLRGHRPPATKTLGNNL